MRIVEVTWSKGEKIFPFIEFLLKHSSKLEKMVFRARVIYEGGNALFSASQKLLNMPRSSPTAWLVFCQIWADDQVMFSTLECLKDEGNHRTAFLVGLISFVEWFQVWVFCDDNVMLCAWQLSLMSFFFLCLISFLFSVFLSLVSFWVLYFVFKGCRTNLKLLDYKLMLFWFVAQLYSQSVRWNGRE